MKILFVCGAGVVGGKERQTLDFMRELRDRGNEVYCANSSWNDGHFERLLHENNIPFSRLRIGFISKQGGLSPIKMTLHQGLYIPSLYWNYTRLLKKWRPCVVIHTNFHHLFLLMPLLGSPKQGFHVHDVFGVTKFSKNLFRFFNTRVDRFIGVSKAVCDNLRQLGIPDRKIELVYNAIREPSPIETQVNTVPVIGIVGQLGAWKGHDVLLNALSRLRDMDWQLHIIGFGSKEYIDSLQLLTRQLDIVDRVVFRGRVEGLPNIYRGINIACVPSTISESFGLSAAEPGFFGIPAVVSNLGGLPEVVVHEQTGLVVPPNDEVGLAEAIKSLLQDPAKRNGFGEAAKQRVNRLFTLKNNVVKMESVLSSLCNQ